MPALRARRAAGVAARHYGSAELQTLATLARAEAGLNTIIERLPGFAGRYQIAPGSTHLPWGRSFAVDVALSGLQKGGG
ncbi:hypothetical protein K2Z83_10090 [Oscillochloris sp. ZM17-4]|uniref:hypothetical protein n=1 Tax=Oscillochloris sp. ZM17-4 TaxID=2866714 RepID=UPI001C73004C|nr:hypothetical protein [Oscillochloris sp. ZM17-4]MBX0328025.1 hypothetical protein [Oscillochloris sp. ZM17-4]